MSNGPITKDNLLSALESMQSRKSKRRDATWYVAMLEEHKVDFHLTIDDEETIRRAGRYLGKRGLDDLIAAARKNYLISPAAAMPSPQSSATTYEGTDLVGIDSGATARVLVVAVRTFEEHSIVLYITNKSTSATITNIGFIIRVNGLPSRGKQIVRSDGKMGPGNYEMVARNQVIETREFIATSAFAFLTASPTDDITSTSFQKGLIDSGIPPGESARFKITAGSSFLGLGDRQVFPMQIERGVIVLFQTAKDRPSEIALFPNFDVLYSTSEPLYQIRKHP